jgi:hypothetical protein
MLNRRGNGRRRPDDIVLDNIRERLLAPDRLAALLQTLADRQAAKAEAVDGQNSNGIGHTAFSC